MATWNSRGLRGSTLEELINRTNEQYREKGLALIQKVPTPITPIRIDQEHRHITLAYFDKKSTVDYIGAVQGIPVCFDAKECQTEVFPLAISMNISCCLCRSLKSRRGWPFCCCTLRKKIFSIICACGSWKHSGDAGKKGGRKSFRMDELDRSFFLEGEQGVLVPYLEGLQKDLLTRD